MTEEMQTSVEIEGTSLTIQDLIAATIRAVQQESPASQPGTHKFKNAEISALIPTFGGGEEEDVESWFNRIQIVQRTYEVPDDVLNVIIIGKLTAYALSWYHSKPSHVSLDYVTLQSEMKKMFATREDKISLMRKFESRRWRRNEKFSNYFHAKVLLGNKLNLEEVDIINYLIDGFDNAILQSQARLLDFGSLSEFFSKMNKITPSDRGIVTPLKSHSSAVSGRLSINATPLVARSEVQSTEKVLRCYNCSEVGHLSVNCLKPKRQRGSCYRCGSMEHKIEKCKQNVPARATADSTTAIITGPGQPLILPIELKHEREGSQHSISLKAMLDTGSPISFVKSMYIPPYCYDKHVINDDYFGVNNSKVIILGSFNQSVIVKGELLPLQFYVVDDNTMNFECILGRDYLTLTKHTIQLNNNSVENTQVDDHVKDIMQIDVKADEGKKSNLDINPDMPHDIHCNLLDIYDQYYSLVERLPEPENDFYMNIVLKHEQPFSFRARRLSFSEQNELQRIIDDLLDKNYIRPSNSPYCSPIVLITKKNKGYRLCVDYRELNKLIIRDHYPLPLIDDQLDLLKGKHFFSCLDLKNGFHHVKISDSSIKYTSFITPLGQFEYLRMPFGITNGPAVFQRFINQIFKNLIKDHKVMLYIDDILVATETIDEHLIILTDVLELMTKNLLELRIDKCKFLYQKINYLGYVISSNGVEPNAENVSVLVNYPVPVNCRDVQRFLGLASYFRRFIQSFSIDAKPLYDLIRKNSVFSFGSAELAAFENLKQQLVNAPVLAIYSPMLETELHCDACCKGFGAILMQKQEDQLFRPIFYFSKRTSDAESRYHSYELEMLAIIYALHKFHVYLQGLKFKIITDCNSIKLALNKKEINPRINRWALTLANYHYELQHRSSNRMKHVDALSRCNGILVLEENTFEQNLSIAQELDKEIQKIKVDLQTCENKHFELRNGLVYKKQHDILLFYVPFSMENKVIFNSHDKLGHVGIDKTSEYILRAYWFPKLRDKVKSYIQNCIKCITHSPLTGKPEGVLHNIPKGNEPFHTLHLDHYGPLPKTIDNKRYIFEVIDAFTKFIKLYDVSSTRSREVINKLEDYFGNYSKPIRIVTDRGSAFTSTEFHSYIQKYNIIHVKVASYTPQANGQIERVNRQLTPMLAKITETQNKWNKVLRQVEFAINNSYHKSIATSPSKLLFGVCQKDLYDDLRNYLEVKHDKTEAGIELLRENAQCQNLKLQNYNKCYYDAKHKSPHVYNENDLVMIRNIDNSVGVNKKLIPKFKGPYVVKRVLGNDRYLITDTENFQVSQIPYEGVCSSANLRLWLTTVLE